MIDRISDRLANGRVPKISESLIIGLLASGLAGAAEGPVPLWDLAGPPEVIGRSEAERAVGLPRLLRTMGAAAGALQWWRPGTVGAWIDALPADHRRELSAIAAVGGVSERRILRTNVIVETCCSVLVSLPRDGQPLRIARNMDFWPAGVTGPATVVKRMRPAGKRVFVSVSWPGYAGVVSGMNDAGVVACVLLNHRGSSHRDGVPITFRLREILEECPDLESAVARFSASPVASEHYAMLADATGAAVVWREGDRVRRADPVDGRLAIDNSPRDAAGNPLGRRALHLLATAPVVVDSAAARALTGATYQRGTNAQAMAFCPAEGRLDLAVGTGWHPAARNAWWAYGADAGAALGVPDRLPHHRD